MVKLASTFAPRRPTSALRYAIAAVFLISLFYYLDTGGHQIPSFSYKLPKTQNGVKDDASPKKAAPPLPRQSGHPIDDLIKKAEATFDDMMAREARTVEDAAKAYRERRGRHPPPGFETWFNFAKKKRSIVVEDFFDQIHHDLEPFWGIQPYRIRKEAATYEMFITVRDGFANTTSDWFWTQIWLDLFRTIEDMLPDMDIALNPMDEPRMVVPWEDMAQYMEKAAETKFMADPEDVISQFQPLPTKSWVEPWTWATWKIWESEKFYWRLARRGCPPTSPARTAPLQRSFADAPEISMANAEPHLLEGYVANATLAKDICHQPDLQGLNGIFIEPLSTSTTREIFPLFGGSKLAVNNEIILPAAMHWQEDERFTGGDDHGGPWLQKTSAVVWRGVATGGRNRETNWKGFQRHRFVSMNNATKVAEVELDGWPALNFALPEKAYHIAAQAAGRLAEWVSTWTNVAFTDLMCEPREDDGACRYTGLHYAIGMSLSMGQQFMLKYLPDVDGNSYSGRYLGFLRSTSLPIKATVYTLRLLLEYARLTDDRRLAMGWVDDLLKGSHAPHGAGRP
ncbi:hypothetical protein BN1723_006719 [Verticillium longisporum]|uniref:Glycosyl transferase CAP10 domain-containing protein n=1 Tax=Verticillium longisporum TaxID=100787 RepID=A0A0G4NGP3_VERLO|nr:hypothetical protein BN1723_006719 [Verticillium longisporum]